MNLKRMELPELNGGLNIRDLPQKINNDQSPDMLNMWFGNRVLSKRWGQEAVNLKNITGASVSLGTIHGISTDFEGYKVIHAGTKLYRWDEDADAVTDLETSVADTEGFFCEFNGRLYHNDGGELRQINADYTVTTVEPYKPLVYINCAPDLSENTANESFNLIGSGFRMQYNGVSKDIKYYVLTVPDDNTFTITAEEGSKTPVDITSAGSGSWQIKRYALDWMKGTPSANASTNVFTLTGHGLSVGETVQFGPGKGTLPGGITAYNSEGIREYKLCVDPMLPLDNTEITVIVNNETKLLNTDYTWDRAKGTVRFVSGREPGAGTNNVEITAYRTFYETNADGTEDRARPVKKRILDCRTAAAFGGESAGIVGGSRTFIMGNGSYRRTYWYSDLGSAQGNGFAYWPDTQYEELVQNNEAITGAAKQGGELIIFKERSLFAISYVFDGEEVYYPAREFNASVGCDIPKSIQLIDNCLVFANMRDGVMRIVSTENASEDRIKPISGNINGVTLRPGLLQEKDLAKATSVDYDRKYWLCTGSNVYVWDYEMTPYKNYTDYEKAQRQVAWFKLSNIPAAHWYGGKTLYYAAGDKLVRFKKDNNDFSDFGQPIEAYWTSKAMDFDLPDYYKSVQDVIVSIKSDSNSTVLLKVWDNKNAAFSKELKVFNFNWATVRWDNAYFWSVIRYAKAFKAKCKLKDLLYCQIKLYNNDNYTDLGATNIVIDYLVNGKVK